MRNYFLKSTVLTLLLLTLASFSFAQDDKFPAPREEKLLNGLNVLIWSQPNTKRVSVKLRIHSGSAFDPKDKEGTIALLSEILFPESGIKNFFEEDLEGKLEVFHTHDYIQINAEAKSDEFLAVLETIGPAISSPPIDKKTLAKVKEKHLEKLAELENDPNYIADQAVAERLYGDFPYGRAKMGTTESLKNIDFADLIFAKQKFLNADNATLTITGDVKSSYAYKAARRLLGGWQKSLMVVPANFRLPAEPETTPLIINVDKENVSLDRFAFESVSRKDTDYFATAILEKIFRNRYNDLYSKVDIIKNHSVKNESKYLRGFFIISKELNMEKHLAKDDTMIITIPKTDKDKTVKNSIVIGELFTKQITQDEFKTAKSMVLADLYKMSPADFWLDIHTYKLNSIESEIKKAKAVSVGDIQRVSKEFNNKKIVEVSVLSTEINTKLEKKAVKPLNTSVTVDQDKDPKDPKK